MEESPDRAGSNEFSESRGLRPPIRTVSIYPSSVKDHEMSLAIQKCRIVVTKAAGAAAIVTKSSVAVRCQATPWR